MDDFDRFILFLTVIAFILINLALTLSHEIEMKDQEERLDTLEYNTYNNVDCNKINLKREIKYETNHRVRELV